MSMKLYEFAVIYNPPQTKEDKDAGRVTKSTLIVDVTRILAPDDKSATMFAARAIPEEYMDKLERCDIVVRPF